MKGHIFYSSKIENNYVITEIYVQLIVEKSDTFSANNSE